MAHMTKAIAILLLVLSVMQLQYQGAVAARTLLEPKEPNEPKGVDRSIDEKGHFSRLEPKEEEAATEGEGDRRKLMAHAAARLLKSNTFAEGQKAVLAW